MSRMDYLQSRYLLGEGEATKDKALKDKKKENKVLAALLTAKRVDLATQLRNKSIRDTMTGKDVYYTKDGMPMQLSRGVAKPTEGPLDTFFRSIWDRKKNYIPMDYSGVEGLSTTNPSVADVSSGIPSSSVMAQLGESMPLDGNYAQALKSGGPLAFSQPETGALPGDSPGGLLGSVGPAMNIIQGLRGMDTQGYRSAGEADKQRWSSVTDALLGGAMFTPLAPIAGPLALGKSLLSWLT